jgi:hypothetical protein
VARVRSNHRSTSDEGSYSSAASKSHFIERRPSDDPGTGDIMDALVILSDMRQASRLNLSG